MVFSCLLSVCYIVSAEARTHATHSDTVSDIHRTKKRKEKKREKKREKKKKITREEGGEHVEEEAAEEEEEGEGDNCGRADSSKDSSLRTLDHSHTAHTDLLVTKQDRKSVV